MWTSIKRIIRSGVFSFWRNGYISLASLVVMAVTLCVIGSVIFSGVILDEALAQIKNKVDINVYFTTSALEEDILALKASIEKLPETAEVEYLSREDALFAFKERHEDDQITLAALDELEDNPLGAQLNIKAKSPSQYASIDMFLEGQNLSSGGDPLIDEINYHENKEAIDKLSDIIDTVDRLSLIVSIVVIVLSVLITFNTIRLSIFISKEEIGVMRLVGASTMYIRGPFVITGIMYGIVSGIITLALLYPITFWFGTTTESFFNGFNIFGYYVSNFFSIAGIILGSGIAIGAVSSFLAVRRYIKF